MSKPSGSLQKKFLSVFLIFCSILGLAAANNMFITNWLATRISDLYEQNAKLQAFLEIMEETDLHLLEYLGSKSDVSLENYYRAANNLQNESSIFNRKIYANDTALLERSIALLSDAYLATGQEAVQAKRARNIEMQRDTLAKSKQIRSLITQYVNELNRDWFAANYAYYEHTAELVRNMMLVIAVVFVLVVFGSARFMLIFMRKTTQPLLLLSKTSDAVSRGNYDLPPVCIDTNDELEVLAAAFNNMLLSIRENLRQIENKNQQEILYRKKDYEMRSHLQEARLKNLQEQVNPHFLFNCLNTASQLALMEGADRARMFIEDLADFYRYSLSITKKDSILRDELAIIKKYVDIMRFRFGDLFQFTADVDESLLNARTPSFILQPIVENAFKHGIGDMESGGEISLRIYRDGDFICIEVLDNGKGFDAQELRSMPDQWERYNYEDTLPGIGMVNVARRIHLYYNETGRFSIFNLDGGLGAAVRIEIPWKGDGDTEQIADRR